MFLYPPSCVHHDSYGVGHAFREGGVMSGFCCVCHVFPPLVSIFGLFPVLVWCDYWLILVQPCLSNYLWFTCVFIVLSVQFDFVWSTRYSRCFLSVSLALSSLKIVIWVNVLVCVFLYPPCCVHREMPVSFQVFIVYIMNCICRGYYSTQFFNTQHPPDLTNFQSLAKAMQWIVVN